MLHELAFTSRRPLSARALWAGKRSGLLDIASQQSVASPSELARVLGARRFDGVERLCLALVAAGGLRCVDSNDGAAVELTELGRSVLRWQRDHLLAPPDNAPDWKALPGLVLGHTPHTDADDAQRWIERMMGENNSSFVEQFEREMAEVTEAETDAALAALACALQGGVSRLRSAVDVGGGNGYFAQQARSQLQLPRDASVHVVELPQVVQKCSALDRIEFFSGDFFDRNKIPQSDLYMMKSVLHDWPDERCIELLESVRQAAERNDQQSLVVALEHPLGMSPTAALRDLQMMCVTGGRERTPSHIAKVFKRAGIAHDTTTFSSRADPLYTAVCGKIE